MPKRKLGTIWRNLQTYCNKGNPDSVKLNDKFSKYRHGPLNSQAAHIVDVNRHPPVRRDNVTVRPQDVPNNASLLQVFTALVIAYGKSGWDVVR